MRPNQFLAAVTTISEGSHRPAEGVVGGHVTRLIADRESGLALLGGTMGSGLGCDASLKLFLDSIVADRGCRVGLSARSAPNPSRRSRWSSICDVSRSAFSSNFIHRPPRNEGVDQYV